MVCVIVGNCDLVAYIRPPWKTENATLPPYRLTVCPPSAIPLELGEHYFTDDLPDPAVSDPGFRRVRVSSRPALMDPASLCHDWASLRLGHLESLTGSKRVAGCLGWPLFCHRWRVKL